MAEPQRRTDTSFKLTRSYNRISARRQLIEQQSYQDEEFLSPEAVQRRLNGMGYTLKQVANAKSQKSIAEIDATSE